MTSTTHPKSATTTMAGSEIVLFARIGPHRITLTAIQLRDTIAAYLARGSTMPIPTDISGSDPNEALHVIAEEALWGNIDGWTASADVVQLVTYRHNATRWITRYFGTHFPELEPHGRP